MWHPVYTVSVDVCNRIYCSTYLPLRAVDKYVQVLCLRGYLFTAVRVYGWQVYGRQLVTYVWCTDLSPFSPSYTRQHLGEDVARNVTSKMLPSDGGGGASHLKYPCMHLSL